MLLVHLVRFEINASCLLNATPPTPKCNRPGVYQNIYGIQMRPVNIRVFRPMTIQELYTDLTNRLSVFICVEYCFVNILKSGLILLPPWVGLVHRESFSLFMAFRCLHYSAIHVYLLLAYVRSCLIHLADVRFNACWAHSVCTQLARTTRQQLSAKTGHSESRGRGVRMVYPIYQVNVSNEFLWGFTG